MKQYHVQLEAGEIGDYVLLPGDPGRVELIAKHLDDAHHVRTNREFTTWGGTLDGVAVSVTSTGIGGPSTAIAVEELCNIGAKTLIRVGSAGAIDPELKFGDLVVVQGAVRGEGTSHQYAPASFPAVATFDVVEALVEAARAGERRHKVGVVSCADAFYPELEPDRMPLAAELLGRRPAYARCGVLAAEMESSTLFVIAAIRGVRCGAVVGVVNEVSGSEAAMPDAKALPLEWTIATAIDGVRRLIATNKKALATVG